MGSLVGDYENISGLCLHTLPQETRKSGVPVIPQDVVPSRTGARLIGGA